MFMSSGLRENIKQIYLVFIDNTKHICYTRNSEIQMTGDFAMAIGERINFFRNLQGMTQKYLGVRVGFPERSADVRLAQYETGTRTPKADMTAALANILDVSPQALSVPDIDSYIGLMHTLFTLEDRYGLKVCECDGEVHLRVDVNHGKDAAELSKSLAAWREQAAKL
jgi:transcriptional regulator with XRE-family HTH domain